MEERSFPNIEVGELLEQNKVKPGWKNLIFRNKKVEDSLKTAISTLHERNIAVTPLSTHVLRAFSFCEPEGIKIVIIGSSPITGRWCRRGDRSRKRKATGLAFSSGAFESDFGDKQAIPLFHKALKISGLLDEGANYHCGHEKWAENGALLLNAALTIPLNDDRPFRMSYHFELWMPFLAGLLSDWIETSELNDPVVVMLWGYKEYENTPNFAKTLWNKIEVTNNTFIILEAHHPTFPRGDNNFLRLASKHFGELHDNTKEVFTKHIQQNTTIQLSNPHKKAAEKQPKKVQTASQTKSQPPTKQESKKPAKQKIKQPTKQK